MTEEDSEALGAANEAQVPVGGEHPVLPETELVELFRELRELQQEVVPPPATTPYAKALRLLDSVYTQPLTNDQAMTLAGHYIALAVLDADMEAACVPQEGVSRIKGMEGSDEVF